MKCHATSVEAGVSGIMSFLPAKKFTRHGSPSRIPIFSNLRVYALPRKEVRPTLLCADMAFDFRQCLQSTSTYFVVLFTRYCCLSAVGISYKHKRIFIWQIFAWQPSALCYQQGRTIARSFIRKNESLACLSLPNTLYIFVWARERER